MSAPLTAVPDAVYHPTTRDPREAGAPPLLTPPRMGSRDRATAAVVARWLWELTPKMTLRGKRVRPLRAVWHGD